MQVGAFSAPTFRLAEADRVVEPRPIMRIPCDLISSSLNLRVSWRNGMACCLSKETAMASPVAHLSVSELAERFMACRDARTATSEAVVAGSSASAKMARFCSSDQTRRVPATTT